MVVANAVAALAEIQENSNRPIFEMTSHTLTKLLTALNECTEYVYFSITYSTICVLNTFTLDHLCVLE